MADNSSAQGRCIAISVMRLDDKHGHQPGAVFIGFGDNRENHRTAIKASPGTEGTRDGLTSERLC
jgi:hypothetical protein